MMFVVTEADYRVCDCGCLESSHGWTQGDKKYPCQGIKCILSREPSCTEFRLNAEMTFYLQNGRAWSREYDPNVLLEPSHA